MARRRFPPALLAASLALLVLPANTSAGIVVGGRAVLVTVSTATGTSTQQAGDYFSYVPPIRPPVAAPTTTVTTTSTTTVTTTVTTTTTTTLRLRFCHCPLKRKPPPKHKHHKHRHHEHNGHRRHAK